MGTKAASEGRLRVWSLKWSMVPQISMQHTGTPLSSELMPRDQASYRFVYSVVRRRIQPSTPPCSSRSFCCSAATTWFVAGLHSSEVRTAAAGRPR